MNRRYFVTGGTGFIGRPLVQRLLARPDTDLVTVLTRRSPDSLPFANHPKVAFHIGDIVDVPLPALASYTHLIHGAAEANDLLQPDQPKYYYTVVEGTRRVFEWAREREIENVLFISSGIVVKDCDTVYCRAKRMGEFIGKLTLDNFKLARVFSVMGEEMPLNGQYALGRFIHQAQYEGRVSYYKSNIQRSYLHVEDVAEWLEAIMDRGVNKLPYDVGGNERLDIEEIARRVGQRWNVPVSTYLRPPRDSIYVPNLAAARSLDLTQTISFDEALSRVRAHLERKYAETGRR